MFQWITENLASILVGLILLAAVLAAVCKIIRDRKSGRGSCGCGCSSCAMNGKCHMKSSDSTP
ncbi:MAG: FeoB-associated Cys-rich membrane protein [Oscillospiraceae bacterium]|nr:FeoB-associated Cys-rich membrane protein [Oscillospiraceae bacterium]